MNSLRQIFANVNGASFVGIDTLTQVKLTGGKNNPQQGRVQKRQTNSSVMVFQNRNSNGYENMVKRRLAQEGKEYEFTLGERAWGVRIPNTPIVEHVKDGETKFYLEVIFLHAGEVEYLLDNVVVPEDQIIGLPARTESKTSQGGLDNKVIIRCFGVDSVVNIRIDGTTYTAPFVA